MNRRNFVKFLASVPVLSLLVPKAEAKTHLPIIRIENEEVVNANEIFRDAPWKNLTTTWKQRETIAYLPQQYAFREWCASNDLWHGPVRVVENYFFGERSGNCLLADVIFYA